MKKDNPDDFNGVDPRDIAKFKIDKITESVPLKRKSVLFSTIVGVALGNVIGGGIGSSMNVMRQIRQQTGSSYAVDAKSYHTWSLLSGLAGAVIGGAKGYMDAKANNARFDEAERTAVAQLEAARDQAVAKGSRQR